MHQGHIRPGRINFLAKVVQSDVVWTWAHRSEWAGHTRQFFCSSCLPLLPSFHHLSPHVIPQNSQNDLLEVNQIMVVPCLNLLVPFYFTFEKSEFFHGCTLLMILFSLSLENSPVPWSPACFHSTSSWALSDSFLLAVLALSFFFSLFFPTFEVPKCSLLPLLIMLLK